MVDGEPSSMDIPLFTDQDLWGTVDNKVQPLATPSTALTQEAHSTQVLEAEQPSRSSELFKSWRLSEQPEHDPNIWKSMLEALEKGQTSPKNEELPLVNSLVKSTIQPEIRACQKSHSKPGTTGWNSELQENYQHGHPK